ncbi:MAG: OmpH family outer membrane protein [Thermoanaerobaculia bacterium]
MKRIAIVLLAAFAAAAAQGQTPPPKTAPAAAAGGLRVAVIDVERLVRDSALGKEAFARLKRINDSKKGEAEKLAKEIREMEQKLADQGQSLADDKREALQKQYQEKAMSFKRFNEDATRELDQQQKKELAELERRVMPVIAQVGREKGFTMIFNKFQSGLVFADDAADVTDDVLRRFNTTVAVPPAAKPAPAAAAGPSPTPAPRKN